MTHYRRSARTSSPVKRLLLSLVRKETGSSPAENQPVAPSNCVEDQPGTSASNPRSLDDKPDRCIHGHAGTQLECG